MPQSDDGMCTWGARCAAEGWREGRGWTVWCRWDARSGSRGLVVRGAAQPGRGRAAHAGSAAAPGQPPQPCARTARAAPALPAGHPPTLHARLLPHQAQPGLPRGGWVCGRAGGWAEWAVCGLGAYRVGDWVAAVRGRSHPAWRPLTRLSRPPRPPFPSRPPAPGRHRHCGHAAAPPARPHRGGGAAEPCAARRVRALAGLRGCGAAAGVGRGRLAALPSGPGSKPTTASRHEQRRPSPRGACSAPRPLVAACPAPPAATGLAPLSRAGGTRTTSS